MEGFVALIYIWTMKNHNPGAQAWLTYFIDAFLNEQLKPPAHPLLHPHPRTHTRLTQDHIRLIF